MVKCYLVLLHVLLACFHSYNAIVIEEITGPSEVESGGNTSVVLDCPYSFNENETEKDSLTVDWSWSLNAEDPPQKVYQWIYSRKPTADPSWKNRVNTDFQVSQEKYQVYRALQILNPDTEMSGNYVCKISTFSNQAEDSKSKSLIVYSPATYLNMSHFKPTEDSVNVSCLADGIYPKPKLTLAPRGQTARPEETEKDITLMDSEYEVLTYKVYRDSNLERDTTFQCILTIPNTNYRVQKEFMYHPSPSSSGVCKLHWLSMILIILPCFMKHTIHNL